MPIGPTRWVAASALVLSLAACNDQPDTRPAPVAALEDYRMLDAPAARVDYVQPDRGYQYAERAYGLQRTFYDVEPDYGFDYGGSEPLVWETADDWSLYAEPYDDGYRYYYYEPGADYPYFVRDDDYGYAYGSGGILVAVFDSGGRYLSRDDAYRAAPIAGRYWARGRDLHSAAHRSRRIAVSDQAWTQVAPRVTRSADPWMRAAREQPRWREWREKDDDRELARFEREHLRRSEGRQHARAERPDEARAILPPPQSARFERRDDRRAEHPDEPRLRAERARADIDRRQSEQRVQVQAHEQQARLQEQARGREQAQARQQAEARAHEGQQRQQQQAQAERRGREEAQRAQQQQQQARGAEQRGRDAATREHGGGQPQARPQPNNGDRAKGGGGRDHPHGDGKDRKD